VTASSLRSELFFLLQASRPGLWLTAIAFYMLPLGQRNVFHSAAFWLGALYVSFPMGLLLYGWNDIVDYEADRLNPRKGTFLFGARGTPEQLRGLPLRIALVQVPFVVACSFLAGAKMLLCFGGMVAAAALYNWRRFNFKTRPPLEILNQAGYLFVFLLSSWMNHVPLLPWATMLFGALFAMHSLVFGEVMDLEPDRTAGRRTTATVIGRVPAKLLMAALMALEAALVVRFFGAKELAAFLLVSAAWFGVDATVIWRSRPYSNREMRFFMLAWNAIALISMPWLWSKAVLLQMR
jgi:4-hydroxybenzoate polyprenyltransferase